MSFQQDEDDPAALVSAGRRRARNLLQRLHGRALSLATLRNRPARVAPGEHDRGLRPRADEITRTLKASCTIASVLSLGYIVLLAVFAQDLLRVFLSSDTPFDEGAFLACGTGIIVLLAVRIPIEFGGLIVQAALLGVGRTRALLDSSLQISAGVWVPLLALVTWLRPSAAAYWLTIAVHTLLRALVNLRSLRRPSRRFRFGYQGISA